MENKSNGMAIASLVCGIVSVVFAFIIWWIGLIAGVLAIIFAVIGRKKAEQGKTGLCTAGLVLGIVGTSLCAVMLVCVLCIAGTVSNAINSINY